MKAKQLTKKSELIKSNQRTGLVIVFKLAKKVSLIDVEVRQGYGPVANIDRSMVALIEQRCIYERYPCLIFDVENCASFIYFNEHARSTLRVLAIVIVNNDVFSVAFLRKQFSDNDLQEPATTVELADWSVLSNSMMQPVCETFGEIMIAGPLPSISPIDCQSSFSIGLCQTAECVRVSCQAVAFSIGR
ncbi:hypothetical protein T4D_4617 [Trichinella pseudospiralis]|uniref:Uncharacterized protein n=1 Tax=Trichinella pseudospiralis TaxID=6337 RepID=A0A0V1FNL3_TRIPS|nr:hypothetical protein T4D_4617 [Trichinella pseudospiralis]